MQFDLAYILSTMTEKPSIEDSAHNLPELTVGELSSALKSTLEDRFGRVRVRGEITGFKRATSGHMYLRLKDDDAVLDGVCWRGTAGRLSIAPEDGMEIVASGRITAYGARSSYQIVIDSMELAGEGALLKLLEERKKRLAEEGLFDFERKQDLPFLPSVIGVVSSPTGAVIRDILHRLSDRFPVRVVLWPVLVQGDGAEAQISAAIEGFNNLGKGDTVPRPDLLIVARGGGSLEDLMAFNEESVVRAAADSDIPLISAVGHETDTTLIDFASDMRAPTPTAAAELAVPVRAELLAQVMDNGARLVNAMSRTLGENRTQVEGLARGLPNLRRVVEEASQRLDDWTERLGNSLRTGLQSRRARLAETAAALPKPGQRIEHARVRLDGEARALARAAKNIVTQREQRLNHTSALLESFSYQRVLERGFALVSDGAGNALGSVSAVTPGMALAIQFHDGKTGATASGKPVISTEKIRKSKKKKDDGKQGNLL
jgi:exodeoxyribonuclease VII large subunit